MIKVSQAQQKLQASVECRQKTELIEVSNALGRIVSNDILSDIMIPQTDNSAMDGFAVNTKDFNSTTSPITLPVSQRIPAGSQPSPLESGTVARIFTGGVMPDGADAVVIQENCHFDSDETVTILKQVTPTTNVRPAGQDISIGAVVVKKGQRLTAVDLSLLASIGCQFVSVYVILKVAIFSTGDELIEPGQPLRVGQIYNSNRTLLIALCRQLGLDPIDCGTVEDTLDATKMALQKAAHNADVIISSGGVSVGEEDHVKPAVEELGSLDLWKVQMKPGKPVAYGQVSGVPFLGLPGNPVSTYVVFQLLGVPLLHKLQGQNHSKPTVFNVNAGFDKKLTSREEYIRVRLERDESGELVAHSFSNLSSGVMSSLSWADGLVRQNIDEKISFGAKVEYLPLNGGLL